MWETQTGKLTTSKRVDIYLFLPEFSTTKIVTWKCHIDKSTNDRYDMILGRELVVALGMDFKLSENVILSREGPFCQSYSQSPTNSELTQSQNMVTSARNANTCMKCQYVVILLTAIQSYTVTHARDANT